MSSAGARTVARRSGGRARRAYGSGSIIERNGTYYGKFRVDGRQVKRRLGRARTDGARDGLTRTQAEAALRRVMGEIRVTASDERPTFEEVGDRYLSHVELVRERKRSTLTDYRIILRKHLIPHFGRKPVDRIGPADVRAYIAAKSRSGLAAKTVQNHLNFAHGVFAFALVRGWITSNPVAMTERPSASRCDPDIRFLGREELEAVLQAVDRQGPLGATDHALYLTAAMTGMRQGELCALRWRDVDWTAGVVRVRRNFTRGEWGTPKSRRSSRAVPMADRLAQELELHFERATFQGDDDCVFCHPQTGAPYDASKMRKRFYDAMTAAGMGSRCGREGGITFHSLRHTFGTRMASVGVPMRTLQEWMGHRDIQTTQVYADYAPDASQAAAFAERAFGTGTNPGTNLSRTQENDAVRNSRK